jgi:citrate synthase
LLLLLADHLSSFASCAAALATGQTETADAKNAALKAVGVRVPISFEDFGSILNELYVELVQKGTIVVRAEPAVPSIPVDYEWANKLGLIRKPSAFVSSIVDERGEELIYAGMKISDVIHSNLGLGGTIGLIWFKKRLPDYFCRFIELVLQVTADHGPAVAGAHNTVSPIAAEGCSMRCGLTAVSHSHACWSVHCFADCVCSRRKGFDLLPVLRSADHRSPFRRSAG